MKKGYIYGISINIILLGIISLLNDMSSEMITPLLPMFLTALGGTGIIIGLVGGLRDSIASLLKVAGGYYSDKFGKRKIFIFSGYFTSSIFKLFLAFSKTWKSVVTFASLERVGKGIRTASIDAIISDSMPKKRGEGFGIHRVFDTTGAILGSILVFILFWMLKLDFKTIILIAAVLAFIAIIPLYFVKEQKRKPLESLTFKISLKNMSKKLKLFILVAAIFALADFSYMFFILKAQSLFTGEKAIGITLLLYILFNVVYALFAVPFGILSDKIGRRKVVVSGYLLFGLTTLGFVFFSSLYSLIILFILYGIVYAMTKGNERAIISDLSPKEIRATALGTFHTIIGLITLPASLIAGVLWEINPSFTFIYGSILSLVSAILYFSLRKYFH